MHRGIISQRPPNMTFIDGLVINWHRKAKRYLSFIRQWASHSTGRYHPIKNRAGIPRCSWNTVVWVVNLSVTSIIISFLYFLGLKTKSSCQHWEKHFCNKCFLSNQGFFWTVALFMTLKTNFCSYWYFAIIP